MAGSTDGLVSFFHCLLSLASVVATSILYLFIVFPPDHYQNRRYVLPLATIPQHTNSYLPTVIHVPYTPSVVQKMKQHNTRGVSKNQKTISAGPIQISIDARVMFSDF